ncbi:Guanine exchange factor for Rac 30 [Stylophora pistillata]|uniref:Guanine exchange factor for Rac 30 n=1 Tax=Stylophora pistillata TaxID=50429 RepID=A0A2B4RZ96_STYPI|nr:Guanine exchange factor for Rac 30 [Stylophora pistillata]
MDREQNLIITSKVKENILVESEVAKVTPPARRKKAEKRNKTGDNSSLPACSQGSTISYGGTHTQAVEKSLKQDVKENREPVNEKNLSEREVTDTKSPETKNGVLKDSCVGEICSSNTGSNGTCVVNSFAGSHDVAVSANDTESVLSSNGNAETEKDSNLRNASEDGKKLPHGFENSREECVSPQDEESFFSAGEEAETYQDKSVTLPEAAEIVEGTSTQSENIDGSALINGKSSNEGEEATALTVDCEEICEFQKSDQTKQRSIFQASEESSENIGNVKEPSLDSIDTKTSSVLKDDANVSDLFRTDSPDSDLLVETESGAVEGTEPCFSDSEQEWSSSSYTSSEGEYDVGFAEEARGIKEEQGTEQDNCIDKVFCVEEILSAFPGFTQIVNVTTDSEDDSNKGDSLTNTFKTVEDSTRENEGFPLNIMSDDDDDGIQMLSHFPPSVCPVMVEITANDSIDDGNSSKQSSKVEGESCDDQRTLAVSTKDEMVPTSNSDQGGENVSDTINYPTKNALLEESHDTKIVDDLESQPVKRTGSFCLINNEGVLKVVDTGQTPVNTENGKDAKLLETNGREVISPDSRVVQSNSDKARKQLGETISETSDLDKEFQNVCKNIEKLEMMSEHNVESSDEFTNETSKDSSGQNREDSKAMVIVVDSMVSTEQTTKLEIKGVTINESASEDCVDGQKDEEINESKEDINTRSPVLVAKRHPKRLLNITRYSLDTQSALLSPEDDAPVELKKIQNSGSFKRGGSSALASESEADGRSPDGQSPDGQQHDKVTPSPPPRGTTNKKPLGHSSSFNTAAVRQLHQREVGKRSKRGRSERSMTLPNNVFDVASRLFTSSSSPEPVHQDPVTLITDNMPATFPGFPIHRRAQIALELYTTERSYVRGLETVVQLFLKPCEENKLLEKKEIKTMFGNLKEIFQINKDVLFNLLYLINHWHDKDQCVGDIFTDEVIERMKIYANYCTNYDSAEALYKQKIKKKEFEVFLNSCYEHPVCQPGLNLPAYLITVVQRIPRYLLLLEDLYKRTPENHPDRNKLNKALTKMSNVAVFINNKLQTSVGQKAMVELRSRVEGLKAFEGQALIKEADVVLSGKKTRKCLLFGDTVVFAVKGVSKTSEVEQTLELATLWCMDLEGNNPQSGKEDSLEIYTPEQSYIIEAGTKTEKKDWLQKLRTRMAMVLHGVEATDKYEIETRKATFKYKNEQVFCGNFVSGKRTGEGILSWPNQARYQGNWEDDDRNGWGELTYNSGDKYKGEWLDDKQHGHGVMEYTNGDIYRGQWYEGDMHGQVMFIQNITTFIVILL